MIERLESRIAPAATFSYFDLDGDKVTITSSKGQNTELQDVLTLTAGVPFPRVEIAKIDLAANPQTFAGTSLAVTVKRGLNGDGFANIGAIAAAGMDLGTITIRGDLGQIDVGDPATLEKAFTSLNVKSMGVFGLRTQGGGDLTSTISGETGPIVIKGDMIGASIVSTDGSLSLVSVGGSVLGGAISSTDSIAKLLVKHSVFGLALSAGQTLGMATFGKSLRSGSIVAGSVGTVQIRGDFQSSDGITTGLIQATTGNIGLVNILGDFLGGVSSSASGSLCGAILAKGNIGKISVGGDWIGMADGSSAGRSGVIDAEGRITQIRIDGSVISPVSKRAVLFHADDDIGSIFIGGDVRGGTGIEHVFITAGGQANPTPGRDIAIGKVTIAGSVNGLHIGGGVLDNLADPFTSQGNGDAQIGTVRVGGDFLNSNIVSGILPGAYTVATDDDTPYAAGTALTNSMIKRIIIGGYVEGQSISVNVHFGFAAQKIGAVSIGGQKVVLQADAVDQFELGRTPSKFSLREV